LAEEAARRAGVDINTLNYLRNILSAPTGTAQKQEASKRKPPEDPVPLKQSITSLKEQAEKLRNQK